LYPYLLDGLTLQETTHHLIQINSMEPTHFEICDVRIVHMEDRENKASSHELITTKPHRPFSWDEGNVVASVY